MSFACCQAIQHDTTSEINFASEASSAYDPVDYFSVSDTVSDIDRVHERVVSPPKCDYEVDPAIAKYESTCKRLIEQDKWFEADSLSYSMWQQNKDIQHTKQFQLVKERMEIYKKMMTTTLVTDDDDWELIWESTTPGDEARFWLHMTETEGGTAFSVQLQSILQVDMATAVLPIQETDLWPTYNKQLAADPRVFGEGAMQRRVQFLEEYALGWLKLEHVLHMSRFINDEMGIMSEVDDYIPQSDPHFPERINDRAVLMPARNRTVYLPTEFQGRNQTLMIMTVLGDLPSWVPRGLIRTILKKVVPNMRADFVKNVETVKGLSEKPEFKAKIDKQTAAFYDRLKDLHEVGLEKLLSSNNGYRVCPSKFPAHVLQWNGIGTQQVHHDFDI